MKRLVLATVFAAGIGSLAATAQSWPQDDPYYRNDPYSRGGYSRQTYGYGGYQDSLINRVMYDIDQAARRANLDGHEAHHFNEVARTLQEFQAKWARGKFDNGKLDKAIENLAHLADADRIRGRDREALSRDLYDLRQFRANRGRW